MVIKLWIEYPMEYVPNPFLSFHHDLLLLLLPVNQLIEYLFLLLFIKITLEYAYMVTISSINQSYINAFGGYPTFNPVLTLLFRIFVLDTYQFQIFYHYISITYLFISLKVETSKRVFKNIFLLFQNCSVWVEEISSIYSPNVLRKEI